MRSGRTAIALLLVRVALGVVFVAHGGQKLFGWFGGRSLQATAAFFHDHYGLAAWLAATTAATEFFGGALVLAGLLTRVAALALALEMLVAALVSGQLGEGFFMNWSGRERGEGFEYNLTLMLCALAVMFGGSGAFGLDRLVRNHLDQKLQQP
jgi:putative oxidoreductase